MNSTKVYIGIAVLILVLIIIGKITNRSKSEKETKTEVSPPKEREVIERLKKDSGGYTIESVDDYSNDYVEAYSLRADGSATWMHIKNLGNGNAETVSKKQGSWDIVDSRMIITIHGNTGELTETYVKNVSGYWTMSGYGRYLKPTK